MTGRKIILLRQVEGARWCVTVRAIVDGKPEFVGRVATARPYIDACRAAVSAAEARRLPIAIQANGKTPPRLLPGDGHGRGGAAMSGVILPMPLPTLPYRGTVCVMGDKATGFQVGHESASGNSWGELSEPFAKGQDAIAAAFALNRDVYLGGCNVTICEAALVDRRRCALQPAEGA